MFDWQEPSPRFMLPSPIPSAPGIAGGPVEASRLDGVGEKKKVLLPFPGILSRRRWMSPRSPREGRGTRRRRGKPFTEVSGARGCEGRYPERSRREELPGIGRRTEKKGLFPEEEPRGRRACFVYFFGAGTASWASPR